MSIDRNAKDPLRLRRNQQRLRVGDNTNSVKLSPTGGITNGTNGLQISTLTAKGDLFTFSTVPIHLPVGTNGMVLSADSTQTTGLKWIAAPTGTVTSVGLSLPGIFTVTGSPVTTSGTLTATLAVQNKNKFWSGPITGVDAAPVFRVIDAADLGVTTKGDLLTFSTVLARLGVGADATVLTADSAQATGMKWAAVAASAEFINGSNLSTSTAFQGYPLYTHRVSTSVSQSTGIGFAIATSNATQTPSAAIIVAGGGTFGQAGMGFYVHTAASTAGALTEAIDIDSSANIRLLTPTTASAANILSQTNGGVTANIGSILFASTTGSTAVTAATDTNFNQSVTLPVNFFTAGKTVRVRGIITFNSDLASTFTSNLKLGSVVLDTRILTPVVSGSGLRAYFDVILTCYSTGVSGTIARMGSFMGEQQANTTSQNQNGPIGGGTVTVNTTATQVLQFSASFSATSVTNTATLSQIVVESLN